jgi:hypothetical protein
MRKREQAAIEAVAKHFSATWLRGENPSDAYVTIAGKRIAVEVTIVKQRIAERADLAKPRLRFDRVALEFVRRLHDALYEAVPDGKTMILTITAPIRMPSKTAAVLEDKIRTCLVRGPVPAAAKDTIHGNEIKVRLVKNALRRASKVIGFVHNPESDPDVLLDMTRSLIECIGTAAGKRTPARFSGDRWLVLANEDGPSHIETYRHVYSQLSVPNDFKKILMVFAGGRVEALEG